MDGAGQMKSSVKRLFGVLEVGQETSAHEGLPELEPLYALMYMHTHRHLRTLTYTHTLPDAEAAGPKSLLKLVPGRSYHGRRVHGNNSS